MTFIDEERGKVEKIRADERRKLYEWYKSRRLNGEIELSAAMNLVSHLQDMVIADLKRE